MDGAGLLPPRSFAAANVATTGEEAKDGGLTVDAFVFVLGIENVSVNGALTTLRHLPLSCRPIHC